MWFVKNCPLYTSRTIWVNQMCILFFKKAFLLLRQTHTNTIHNKLKSSAQKKNYCNFFVFFSNRWHDLWNKHENPIQFQIITLLIIFDSISNKQLKTNCLDLQSSKIVLLLLFLIPDLMILLWKIAYAVN